MYSELQTATSWHYIEEVSAKMLIDFSLWDDCPRAAPSGVDTFAEIVARTVQSDRNEVNRNVSSFALYALLINFAVVQNELKVGRKFGPYSNNSMSVLLKLGLKILMLYGLREYY